MKALKGHNQLDSIGVARSVVKDLDAGSLLVMSINTGALWSMKEVEVSKFMAGRRPEFYRILGLTTSQPEDYVNL